MTASPTSLDRLVQGISSPHSAQRNHDRQANSRHDSGHSSTSETRLRTGKGRDSKLSLSTGSSARSHQDYLNSLEVPTPEMVERIAAIQEAKEAELLRRRRSEHGNPALDGTELERAASLIQRNYRGHRERRMLAGLSLDPTTRWREAVKEAQYRNLTLPKARSPEAVEDEQDAPAASVHSGATINAARQNWKKIGLIARRAGGDEESDSASSEDDENTPEHEREERRRRKTEAKLRRQQAAKIMDLQYFLEIVDVKHRYGSNLRTYHEEWVKAETHENFFYWLDYGEGRFIDCQVCPREKLDREQVRYLSKEERLNYLVKIDNEGRLCWAKNGVRIDTTEAYKDSMHGIVPASEDAPVFRAVDREAADGLRNPKGEASTTSDEETNDRANLYATPEFDKARGMKKISHVSATTIINKLLRSSVQKNTWIFVADTSFRLYVGIKQSGTFQHSSFLHGSRISAAGSIEIKNGRLCMLSPLSGHYRPPVSNFRAFTHSIKEAGADMSHVSISRSYAVLVGLEAYVKARRRGKSLVQKLMHGKDKILSPEELAKRQEAAKDHSESAAKEQKFLELKQEAEKKDKENHNRMLLERTHLAHSRATSEIPEAGPENVIAPGERRGG